MSKGAELGIVAALEREVRGIVRNWRVTKLEGAAGEQRVYEGGNAVLLCAGTGITRAYAGAQLLVEKYSPKMLVSMGFAGACSSDPGSQGLRSGAIFVPGEVIESATGKKFVTAFGRGKLVTLDKVAGKGLKQCSAARYGASAVDMEAAGVAAVASGHGLGFVAIKAISDGAEDDLGFLSGFVTPEGFQTGRFVAHIAVRPWLWKSVAQLGRNSQLAAKALEEAVRACTEDWKSYAARFSSLAAQVEERES